MKKRILSILLALCMVLGFMPTIAFAEDDHTHCICGGENSVGDHTAHTAVTWTGVSSLSEITAAGNYFLKNDVTFSDTWTCSIDGVNLCLNGKTITSTKLGNAIRIFAGESLSITDCRETVGKITHNESSGGGIGNIGTLTLWNGSITDNVHGSGVYNYGTFTMNGGRIENNSAMFYGGGVYNDSGSGDGGGVFNHGTFTMNGGSIRENESVAGGGVFNNGMFNMYGGTISGNQVEDGGGVYNEGTFTMTSGSISGNKGIMKGGGVFNDGTFIVSGDVNISGNVRGGTLKNGVITGGTTNNVYLANGKTVTVEEDKPLADTAKVGITVQNPASNQTVVTGTVSNVGFFSDDTNYDLIPDGKGGLKLGKHTHCICGGENGVGDHTTHTAVTWTGISALSEITAAGNYYLRNDVILSNYWKCNIDGVNLCLNGKSITGADKQSVIIISSGKSLTITDCRETVGKITHNPVETGRGILNNGTLTLWNSSITGNGGAGQSSDGVYNRGNFIMNGGSIDNNRSEIYDGGGVHNCKSADFTMNGGSIKNNKSIEYSGGGVYNEGTFTLNGGSIENNSSGYGGGGVYNYMATFTMNGGSITGNKVNPDSPGSGVLYGRGGGVLNNFRATFVMNGGTISGNWAKEDGGGVYNFGSDSECRLSGRVTVTGNTSGGTITKGVLTGNTVNNICLPNGKTITVEVDKPLAATARIGITAADPASYPTVVTGTTDTTGFFSDNADYMLVGDGSNALKLTDALVTVSGVKLLNEVGGAEMTDGKAYDGKAVAYDDSAVSYTPTVSGVSLTYTWQVKNGGTYSDLTAAPKAAGSYRLLVSAVKNGNTLGTQSLEFTINSYNANGSEYSVNSNDWLNADFAVTAAEGWQLSYTNTADGNWVSSLTVSEENNSGTLEFYLKNTSTGVISEKVTEHYKIDKTAPTGEVRIDERNAWQIFVNAISFNLFYKDEQTVTITANDSGSGIAKREYLVTAEDLTIEQLAGSTFTSYSSAFGIEPDAKLIVYARITDAAGNMTYLRSDGIVLDSTAPVINGADNGKTYCEAVTLTVTDEYLDTVTLNGEPVTLTDGKLTVNPAEGRQTVIATDKAGNSTSITVTVNDGHTWGEWVSNGDNTHTRVCSVNAKHAETDDCHGGNATCRDRAVCDDCKTAYGEADPKNHADLRNIKAKAATKDVEGNIEYWYCDGCDRYYSDKDGTKEIQKAETVIEKLKDDATSPHTGDSSNLSLWIALLFISGGAVIGTTVVSRKKKQERE